MYNICTILHSFYNKLTSSNGPKKIENEKMSFIFSQLCLHVTATNWCGKSNKIVMGTAVCAHLYGICV